MFCRGGQGVCSACNSWGGSYCSGKPLKDLACLNIRSQNCSNGRLFDWISCLPTPVRCKQPLADLFRLGEWQSIPHCSNHAQLPCATHSEFERLATGECPAILGTLAGISNRWSLVQLSRCGGTAGGRNPVSPSALRVICGAVEKPLLVHMRIAHNSGRNVRTLHETQTSLVARNTNVIRPIQLGI